MPNEQEDVKFLKYKTRILAVNTGDQPDRLTQNITVPTFRGYQPGEVIPAGTLLRDIITKEFNSTPPAPKVIISVTGSGTTVPAAGSHDVTYGGSFTITSATPATGHKLSSVTVDGAAVTLPHTISNITSDHTVRVIFEELPPTTTFTVTPQAGSNGSISPATAQSFNENDPVNITYTATPATGYQVDKWQVNGVDDQVGGDTFIFTLSAITANQTVKVLFKAIPVTPTYTITGQVDGGNGSISPTNAGEYDEGSNVGAQTFTAAPNTGYEVDKWFVDSAEQSGETGTTFTLPAITGINKNYVVKVKFKELPAETYTVTVTDNTPSTLSGAGTISPAAGSHTVNVGTDTTVTVTANSGFKIKTFTVDGVDKTSPFTITGAAKDQTVAVVVEFEKIPTAKPKLGYIQYTRTTARNPEDPPTAANFTKMVDQDGVTAEGLQANGYTLVPNSDAKIYQQSIFLYPTEVTGTLTVKQGGIILTNWKDTTINIDGTTYRMAYNTEAPSIDSTFTFDLSWA